MCKFGYQVQVGLELANDLEQFQYNPDFCHKDMHEVLPHFGYQYC